jgi:hypothetical protein
VAVEGDAVSVVAAALFQASVCERDTSECGMDGWMDGWMDGAAWVLSRALGPSSHGARCTSSVPLL